MIRFFILSISSCSNAAVDGSEFTFSPASSDVGFVSQFSFLVVTFGSSSRLLKSSESGSSFSFFDLSGDVFSCDRSRLRVMLSFVSLHKESLCLFDLIVDVFPRIPEFTESDTLPIGVFGLVGVSSLRRCEMSEESDLIWGKKGKSKKGKFSDVRINVTSTGMMGIPSSLLLCKEVSVDSGVVCKKN